MKIKIERNEIGFGAASFLAFLAGFLLIKVSGFSSSSIVNIQSYFLRAILTQTTGMTTIESLSFVFQPFVLVLVGLAFYVLSLSILTAYGYQEEKDEIGKFVGIFSAIAALVLFQSLWGAFLAASVLISCVFSAPLANTYKKELKRWEIFRVGSHTVGKMFSLLMIFMSVGIFVMILSNQAQYASMFKQDLIDMTQSIAMSVPGAELVDPSIINSQIEGLVETSPMFESYVTWLPVMTAMEVWFALSFVALFATMLAGAFTYAIIKIFKLE